jgi:hypothetical protein
MYGLWVIGELWVMGQNSLRTKLVTMKMYGLSESMGYERYGLRESRLYKITVEDPDHQWIENGS